MIHAVDIYILKQYANFDLVSRYIRLLTPLNNSVLNAVFCAQNYSKGVFDLSFGK